MQLDNPTWSALTSGHAALARGDGLARRYPSAISRLAAIREPSPAAFADLRALVAPGERIGLFSTEALDVPSGWEIAVARWIDQMVCEAPAAGPRLDGVVELGAADAAAMQALTSATQPGPWAPRTYEMGRYIGVRDGSRLVAMAGERLRLDGWTEISAVCTDPAYTGRGYAAGLMRVLMDKAVREGRRPMLHVKTENGAKRLYERLGFRVRRELRLTSMSRV
jgi:ribosomal protein S18 acetylase RimI-like enzyme